MPRRSATSGSSVFWELGPPLEADEVAAIMGQPIPPTAWDAIEWAYVIYSRALAELAGTRANNNKNDERGWRKRKVDTLTDLDIAVGRLERALDRKSFLREAVSNYHLQKAGRSGGQALVRELTEALGTIVRLRTIIERAEAFELPIQSNAEARSTLCRAIYSALKENGVEVPLSDNWTLGGFAEGPAETDLQPFERLVAALGIHDNETPLGLARWVRRAVGQKPG